MKPNLLARYFLIGVLLFISLMVITCSRDKASPDCFETSTTPWRYTDGCGNAFVYGRLSDSVMITVRIDMDQLPAQIGCQSFSLPHNKVVVTYVLGTMHPDSVYFEYCSDVVFPNQGREQQYIADQGLLTIAFTQVPILDFQHIYRLSLLLEGAQFTTPHGVQSFSRLQWGPVQVGWLPG